MEGPELRNEKQAAVSYLRQIVKQTGKIDQCRRCPQQRLRLGMQLAIWYCSVLWEIIVFALEFFAIPLFLFTRVVRHLARVQDLGGISKQLKGTVSLQKKSVFFRLLFWKRKRKKIWANFLHLGHWLAICLCFSYYILLLISVLFFAWGLLSETLVGITLWSI